MAPLTAIISLVKLVSRMVTRAGRSSDIKFEVQQKGSGNLAFFRGAVRFTQDTTRRHSPTVPGAHRSADTSGKVE